MPDHVYLSLWLRGYNQGSVLRHFEKALRVFPFSRLRPGVSALRVYAIEFAEPAVIERYFPEETDVSEIVGLAAEVEHPDCAYSVDAWWDLWQYEAGGWKLAPSPVTISCFGPEFENDEGDHIRFDFGPESAFIPLSDAPAAARRAQSNLQSLVRLARDVEAAVAVERRSLWADSGEDFSARVDEAFSEAEE